MPVANGTRLGSYEVVSLLGAGGMGEVYRAHDARLGRTIAIKVLPDAWAFDPDRLARFEREAKVLASLNHPHIAALYGFEEAEGRRLLVMELVEGEISDLVVTNARGEVDVLKLTPGAFQTPRISPDGKRVAYVAIEGQANIWVYDLDARTAPRRLTFVGNNRHPLWSADGRYLVFQSDREGDLGIFRQLADVTGTAAERLTKPDMGTSHIPESWSRKDDLFLFSALDGSAATLWSYSMRDKTPMQVGNIRSSSALNAELSPDGRWIAYTLRGGEVTTAINLEPFPTTGERRQISSPADLAHHAVWSPDAGTLFFIPGAQPLVGVSVTQQPTLAVGDPHVWPGKLPNNTAFGAPRNFDIFPDGKRFIAPRLQNGLAGPAGPPVPQVQVVVNWLEEFRSRQQSAK